MPAIFVGVDVFHAPMVYDPESKQRRRKASCAAIIIEVIRNNTSDQALVEIYSETWKRSGGNEYQLGDALQQTITNARKVLKVNPLCVVVWRDGIGESEFDRASKEEIEGIRKGLRQGTEVVDKGQSSQPQTIPLAYVVCQKRIATKFLTLDGRHGAPSGTLVKGIQGLKHETFYINGRAPPFSTPKPVRYIIIEEDDALADLPLEELTWGQCHNYPNWTGPIKVPSACQMAHKLAELAGSFVDCGETINAERFKNKIHFL
jgi:aubergine-like protein